MEVNERNIKISSSVICMDFFDLKHQITSLNNLADLYHFDIIDNHFAPWFGLPFELLISLKKVATLPIDVHLIVDSVEQSVEKLIQNKPEMITIHIESITSNAFRIIHRIQDAKIKVGVAINPITPIENLNYVLPFLDKVTIMTFDPGMAGQKFVDITLNKISELSTIKATNKFSFDIEVDGSCNKQNFQNMFNAGANQFVLGTSGLFSLDNNIEVAWNKMLKYMKA